jgi:hypothetical protein
MAYTVACECGKNHSVHGGQANSSFACDCGKTVEVPRLSTLRSSAGEAPLGLEYTIEQGIRNGTFPTANTCAHCQKKTSDTVYIWALCDRATVEEGGWKMNWIPLIFGWLSFSNSEEKEVGRDVQYRLPLRLCKECEGISGETLKAAFEDEPVYKRLLAKYPDAKLSMSKM